MEILDMAKIFLLLHLEEAHLGMGIWNQLLFHSCLCNRKHYLGSRIHGNQRHMPSLACTEFHKLLLLHTTIQKQWNHETTWTKIYIPAEKNWLLLIAYLKKCGLASFSNWINPISVKTARRRDWSVIINTCRSFGFRATSAIDRLW